MNAILTQNPTSKLFIILPRFGKPIVCGLSQFGAISLATKRKLKLVGDNSTVGRAIAKLHGIL